MDEQIGINKTGGIGYIAGLPSFTNMPDFTAPQVPTINKVTDASRNVIGKTEANAKVTLYINDKLQGTKIADKAGNYKFSIKKQNVGTKIKVTSY